MLEKTSQTPASFPVLEPARPFHSRARRALVTQSWFLWPLGVRLLAWIFLAHAYEIAVFQDVSLHMASGEGIYARFSTWFAAAGDGYYAYPPLYAYMLWVSGWLAGALGGSWWLHQFLIKFWLVLADAIVMAFLLRIRPAAARAYWTLWFVPIVAVAQVQPDLWVGLSVALALFMAARRRWAAVGLLIALGGGLKPVPFIILPFLGIYLMQQKNWRGIATVGAAALAGMVLTWLPYLMFFDDAGSFVESVRFYVARPAAGLTIPSGLALLMNGAASATALLGYPVPWAEAVSRAVSHSGIVYPAITLAALAAFTSIAAIQRWPLWRVFTLPLLVFLLANNTVHEHYLLQVLPLLLVLGFEIRALVIAFSAYLVAAGTPLRFFPSEFGLPSTMDALLPPSLQPTLGVALTVGLMIVAGAAALVFSLQVFRLIREAMTLQARPDAPA